MEKHNEAKLGDVLIPIFWGEFWSLSLSSRARLRFGSGIAASFGFSILWSTVMTSNHMKLRRYMVRRHDGR
jgi:hypothetical protein